MKDTKDLGVHFYFTLDKEKKTKRKIDALTWNQVTGSQKKKLTASLDVSKYYLDKKAGQKVFLFVLFSPPPSALTLPFFCRQILSGGKFIPSFKIWRLPWFVPRRTLFLFKAKPGTSYS